MRKFLSLVFTLVMIFSAPAAFSATPRVGGSCTKINQFHESKSTLLVCAVDKGKKTWRKATTAEKSLYLLEKKRIEKAKADKIAQDAKIKAEIRIAVANELAKAAAAKAAAEKAAAEKAAAEKAAAEKAAAEKAAAEKAAAEKAAAEKAAAEKAAAARCALSGIDCKVGDTGPGGGIVFYDAGSQQSWGRYLEFAPSGWSGRTLDPSTAWCNRNIYLRVSTKGIGSGKTNTDLMLNSCSSGAAVLARSYRGGGKTDWSLPSRDELRELFNHVSSKAEPVPGRQSYLDVVYGGFNMDVYQYWASFDYDSGYAHALSFGNLYGSDGGEEKEGLCNVRPIRSF